MQYEQESHVGLTFFLTREINMVYERCLEFWEEARRCGSFITESSVSWYVLMFCNISLETLILLFSPTYELPRASLVAQQ